MEHWWEIDRKEYLNILIYELLDNERQMQAENLMKILKFYSHKRIDKNPTIPSGIIKSLIELGFSTQMVGEVAALNYELSDEDTDLLGQCSQVEYFRAVLLNGFNPYNLERIRGGYLSKNKALICSVLKNDNQEGLDAILSLCPPVPPNVTRENISYYFADAILDILAMEKGAGEGALHMKSLPCSYSFANKNAQKFVHLLWTALPASDRRLAFLESYLPHSKDL